MEALFQKDDVCYLRRHLHPKAQQVGSEIIPRGTQGTVYQVRGTDNTVKVYFSNFDAYVRCKPEWLESSPGMVCKGINTILANSMHLFYETGMMVSDLRFPIADKQCFARFCEHRELLLASGLGFSFYDGVIPPPRAQAF